MGALSLYAVHGLVIEELRIAGQALAVFQSFDHHPTFKAAVLYYLDQLLRAALGADKWLRHLCFFSRR